MCTRCAAPGGGLSEAAAWGKGGRERRAQCWRHEPPPLPLAMLRLALLPPAPPCRSCAAWTPATSACSCAPCRGRSAAPLPSEGDFKARRCRRQGLVGRSLACSRLWSCHAAEGCAEPSRAPACNALTCVASLSTGGTSAGRRASPSSSAGCSSARPPSTRRRCGSPLSASACRPAPAPEPHPTLPACGRAARRCAQRRSNCRAGPQSVKLNKARFASVSFNQCIQ